MFQQMTGQGKHAALHFDRGHIFRLKFLGGKRIRSPGINFGAARKNVEGSEIIFRPGMNRQMRLGNDDHAGDPVRVKRMEDDIHDPRMRMFGRFHHDGFNFMNIVQDFGIAMVKFDQKMSSKRSQGEKIIDLLF
jgi:hypothetical protein